MKVDTMRKVDYYAGVPLCFVATLVKKLFAFFAARSALSRPKNILLIELSEMGSTILADPMMQKLKRVDGINLHFAIFKKNSASLKLLGTVPPENVYTIDESGLVPLIRDAFRFPIWTRRRRIDAVIDMELFSRFTALLTASSGAQCTVGFHAFYQEGLYRGDFLTHKVAYNPHQHIAKNFIALANALLSDKPEYPFSKTVVADHEMELRKVVITEAARESMRGRIRGVYPAYDGKRHRIILINANASELLPIRRWPKEYYVRLAGMILDHYADIVILLTGGAGERAWIEALASSVHSERCINFAGQTALTELPALYSLSAFMLSNDSGPPHFASVTGMPTFVFFGPETPYLYRPLGDTTPLYAGLACSPCVSAANHRKTACNDNVCLQIISPEQVFDALKPKLESTP